MIAQLSNPLFWLLALGFACVAEFGGLHKTVGLAINGGAQTYMLVSTIIIGAVTLGWWCLLSFCIGTLIHGIRTFAIVFLFRRLLDREVAERDENLFSNYKLYWHSGLASTIVWPICMTTAVMLHLNAAG